MSKLNLNFKAGQQQIVKTSAIVDIAKYLECGFKVAHIYKVGVNLFTVIYDIPANLKAKATKEAKKLL